MAVANTPACFREVIGKRVIGLVIGRMSQAGQITLVFDDGSGLVIAGNGSYWRESRDLVRRAIECCTDEADKVQQDVKDLRALLAR